MKKVTIETVRERIAELEGANNLIGLDLHAEFELACLRQLLASLKVKPELWEIDNPGEGTYFVRDAPHDQDWRKNMIVQCWFAEPPVPVEGVEDDVRNIIRLLVNNEWAEHCTKTGLGKRLESEITRLVGYVRPVQDVFNIGDATMRHVFKPTGMTDVSDMQAVFDRVEVVLAELLEKLRIAESDRDKNGWYVHECARLEREIECEERPARVLPDDLLATFTRQRLLEIIVTGPDASGAEQNALARIALALMPPAQPEQATDNTAQQFEALATSAEGGSK